MQVRPPLWKAQLEMRSLTAGRKPFAAQVIDSLRAVLSVHDTAHVWRAICQLPGRKKSFCRSNFNLARETERTGCCLNALDFVLRIHLGKRSKERASARERGTLWKEKKMADWKNFTSIKSCCQRPERPERSDEEQKHLSHHEDSHRS